MKVGDLVTYTFQLPRWRNGLSISIGLIAETGEYTANCDVKVLWSGSTVPVPRSSQHLSLVDDALTFS